MAATAAPWIIGGISTLAGAQGNKKAAKEASKGPQIPREFAGNVGMANQLITNRFQYGIPRFMQPGGDVMTPLQNASTQGGQTLLGQGQAGFNDALAVMRQAAATGISPEDLRLIREETAPMYQYDYERGLAGAREAAAQGGRFFSSGAVSQEQDFINQFLARQRSEQLPLALQAKQSRMAAAGAIPGMFQTQAGGIAQLMQMGEQERVARLNEFVRTQPEAMIPLLSGLMSGTPMYQQTPVPNALQGIAQMGNSMMSSPGFWQYLQSKQT